MNKNEKILAALVTSVAAGVLLGILFAPAKGSETRQKIAATPADLAGKLRREFNRCKEKNAAVRMNEPKRC